MSVKKKEVVRHLETIAIYMELKGENSFKIAAYRKAAAALAENDEQLENITDFMTISGIGKGTSAVIDEFMKEGSTSILNELKEDVPQGLIPLLQLPGLGGKKIAKLYKELKINNATDLKEACRKKEVQKLAGFGEKTEEKLFSALENIGTRPERLPIAYMLPIAEKIESELADIVEIKKFSRAGSMRRTRETIKDLDFIIATENLAAVKAKLLKMAGIKEVIAAGDTKVSLVLEEKYDVSVDFRLVKPQEYATTLHHFTGSKEHNVRMRQLAKERGEKISEYGVENNETNTITTFETEEEFYAYFDLPFIPPEIREDGKEVEAYTVESNLLSLADIKGDLHMHTTWSDGAFSIEEMVEAARTKGYTYIAITDHSQFLKVANGLTPERLRKQQQEIKRLNEKFTDITILSGVEMDILPDGTLDYEDEMLAELDIVIASIHSAFSQPKEKIMERLARAMQNPYVNIIAHPTGRMIGRREGYEVDIQMLIKLAKETNTALELNANPNRLDLSAQSIRLAQDAGVKIAINTDAHKIKTLDHMSLGVATARKGWIRKETVLNAMKRDELLQFFHNKRIGLTK